jgi:similar to stage IV sporulation protein
MDNTEFLAECQRNGLYFGCITKQLDCNKITENLKNKYKKISWMNISIVGSRAYIKIAWNNNINNIKEYNIPCNIVADKNCVISSVITESGTPQVKKGDTVAKGEILISGMLLPVGTEEELQTREVTSSAKIRGIVEEKIKFKQPYAIKIKQFNKKEYNIYSLRIFNVVFSDNFLYNINSDESYDKIDCIQQMTLGQSIKLPIYITKEIYKQYTDKTVSISDNTAMKLLEKSAHAYIINNYSTDSNILDVSINSSKTAEYIEAWVSVTSEESIGVIQQINTQEDIH